jgi:density-regulated protein
MGRNKKKSKAAAHAASDSDEERDETHEAAAETTTHDVNTGESKDAPESAAGQPSGRDGERGSGDDSDADSDAPKKKKEYKGNRLKKQERNSNKGKGKGKGGAAAAVEGEKVNAAAGENDDEAEPQDTRIPPVEVLYCPNCTFPAEYCEFGGMMDKCRPWLLEHAAELADAEDRGRKRRILTEKERLEALLEGRGIKKALERIVVIDVEKRTGKRVITSVFGMDLFGFNLKDLAREWRKCFSCGGGVRAAEEGKHQDCVDIQGNVEDALAEMLVTKYSIPKTAVYRMEGKKKVPYPY